MLKIDVERLIDLVGEEHDTYLDYRHKAAKLYSGGTYEDLKKREKALESAYHYNKRAEDALQAIVDVFRLDGEQRGRLYIAARAVKRWRIRTDWAWLIPETMQGQIERFIFGSPSAPSAVCARCGCWEV